MNIFSLTRDIVIIVPLRSAIREQNRCQMKKKCGTSSFYLASHKKLLLVSFPLAMIERHFKEQFWFVIFQNLIFIDTMTKKERSLLSYTYQSDQEETEDEEVKRNCVMGESGMRDSDFSDSGSDTDEDHDQSHSNRRRNGISNNLLMVEDRMGELVKFVTVGSPIVKPKGLVLYRPKAIMADYSSHAEKPDENDKALREDSETKL